MFKPLVNLFILMLGGALCLGLLGMTLVSAKNESIGAAFGKVSLPTNNTK